MRRLQTCALGCLVMAVTFACQQQQYTNAEKIYPGDFGEAIYLTGEEMEFDEPVMKPRRLLLLDSIMLIYNLDMDPMIHKYNLNTRRKTGECISFGSGPEDFIYIQVMQESDSTVWLADIQKRVFQNYLRTDICCRDKLQSLKRISIDEMFNDAWIFPDHRIIATGFNPGVKRFSFYSSEGMLIREKGDYPSFGVDLTDLEKMEGFTGMIAVNYPANRIYVFCLATDLMEIYDLEGELIKRIHGPDHFFPCVQEKRNGEITRITHKMYVSRDAFSNPVIVDDEVFVLYSGTYFEPDSRNIKDQVLVYGREGNPVRRYKLSEKLYHIAVDAKNKIIYGLCDYPEFHILKFHY
jgi:hypothetical protein